MERTWNLGLIAMKQRESACWVQFNRPDKLNVLSPEMLTNLEEGLAICEAEEDVRVVVVTGDDRAFMAGNDVRRMADGGVVGAQHTTEIVTRAQQKLANLPKPTIAAVAGYALGAGLEIALCCDFRIAADNAVLGSPEINLGIIPGGGGTQRLPRLVGLAAANKIVMLGETMTGAEAERVGLVDKVVPLDSLEDEVNALAAKLAQRPPLALRAAKAAMRSGMNGSLAEGLELEQALFSALFGTEDQREGMAAFLEKRKPSFKGR
jgi:enoyl-CoA hydratase/carnithine racemase